MYIGFLGEHDRFGGLLRADCRDPYGGCGEGGGGVRGL